MLSPTYSGRLCTRITGRSRRIHPNSVSGSTFARGLWWRASTATGSSSGCEGSGVPVAPMPG